MLFLLALTALATWGVAATVLALRSDGYGPRPTEWARIPDRNADGRRAPAVGPHEG
ncbi:hypothetical protein N8K70_16880 [Microbacterium betulae]|uniref:Uncharacterized protein n=1 Tax=Microbacterium betulae TaxID=2981139 RepID=A0AA97FH41_9MICO|nr:hypothetical protein [Microbacterium sp. AB]WOF23048.1 hypothetical protein N8K70_16880 [Microbacterium sp. AB]